MAGKKQIKRKDEDMTEAQKAAMLVMSLDGEKAASVLQNMSDHTIARLGKAVESLQNKGIKNEHKIEALKSFFLKKRRGGILIGAPSERFRKVLVQALGEDKARELGPEEEVIEEEEMSQVEANRQYVESMEDEVLAEALSGESPRTGAVMIAMLGGERVGKILNLLEADLREKLLNRIIASGNISADISEEILAGFCEKLRKISDSEDKPGPGEQYQAQELSQMLLTLEKESRDRILNQLKEQNPDLAEELERLMLQFEDIVKVADRSLQELMRNIETNVIAMALKGAPEELAQKVMDNISERMQERVQEERELSGRVPMRDVKQAREEIMQYARQLYREGSLVVETGGEEFVE